MTETHSTVADPDAGRPQPVIGTLTQAAIFLVVTVEPAGRGAARDVLADLQALTRSVGFRVPDGELSVVAGLGSAAWDAIIGGPRPDGLHPFRPVAGPLHRAPATPGDLLFHIRAQRMDLCFELAGLIVGRLGPRARVVDEVHGFRYFEMRDLLGFADGTENPDGKDAVDAVLVGDEDPSFRGGSYVVVQKYLHDLAGWQAAGTDEQERIIGRTKLSDVELDDQPPDSHVARSSLVDPDGTEHQILRFNMPFGAAGGDAGTYFIGYAADPTVIERMLDRMFLGDAEAAHDRILDFSTAVTGGLFFVPPLGKLQFDADPGARGPGPAVPGACGTGSLGIGDLKGQS